MRIDFHPFALDFDARQLTLEGREVHLAPKALELLAALIIERPTAVSKEILQGRLWPGTFVVEANLSNLVGEIREALGDSARAPRFVRTVHGFGYAFCGQCTEQPGPREAATRVSCWVESDGRRVPLRPGEHMIGRDADVEVRIDASTVSRRHARIIVTADGAVLYDCGSKNGTFRGNERVTSSTRLADGDMIRIGSQLICFHVAADLEATDTQTDDTA